MGLISPHGNDNRMKSVLLAVCPGLILLRQGPYHITEDGRGGLGPIRITYSGPGSY